MKHFYFIGVLIFSISAFSQTGSEEVSQTDEKKKREELENFIKKIIGTKTDNTNGSFVFDATNSPEVKFNIPVYRPDDFNQFYIDGKVASTNDYTPLIKKGTWQPDLGLNANFTYFICRSTRFYIDELLDGKLGLYDNASDKSAMLNQLANESSITEASQIFWLWINAKAGYNYASLETFIDDPNMLNKDKFIDNDVNSFMLSGDLNFYFYPSKHYAKWFSMNGKLGYEFKSNDNNFNSLKTVKVYEEKTITDSSGNSIIVSTEEKKVKEGTVIIKNSSNINYNLMFLFSLKDFYIGLSNYAKRKLTNDLESTDMGFGITVPITKKKDKTETAASITLKYEIPDISNEISDVALKDKGIFGFTIGLPLSSL